VSCLVDRGAREANLAGPRRIPAIVATLTGSSCHRGVEDLGGRPPAEDPAEAMVEALLDGEQISVGLDSKVGALGEVLTEPESACRIVPSGLRS
jgi:hypothetical protein